MLMEVLAELTLEEEVVLLELVSQRVLLVALES